MSDDSDPRKEGLPEEGNTAKAMRGALQVASGAVPYVGGVLSAIVGAWSEREQAKVNHFFEQWVKMLENEIREKEASSDSQCAQQRRGFHPLK